MKQHSEDYKISAVKYYLESPNTYEHIDKVIKDILKNKINI